VKLCGSYKGAAASKVSPQLVAGSYVGWLSAILRHLTGRYQQWRLEALADEEALEAVYNYAHTYQVPITDHTAPYLATSPRSASTIPSTSPRRSATWIVVNPQEGLTLERFSTIGKARFYLDQDKSVEAAGVPVDLHAVSEREDGTDLIVEVKALDRAVTRSEAAAFVKTRETLAGRLEKKTGFLFYSASGLSSDAAAVLEEAGVMFVDVAKLAGYEMPRP